MKEAGSRIKIAGVKKDSFKIFGTLDAFSSHFLCERTVFSKTTSKLSSVRIHIFVCNNSIFPGAAEDHRGTKRAPVLRERERRGPAEARITVFTPSQP